MDRSPAYPRLAASGELAKRAEVAHRHLEECDLCARYCRVNRCKGIEGAVCRTGERAEEYREALEIAARYGLTRLDQSQRHVPARQEFE